MFWLFVLTTVWLVPCWCLFFLSKLFGEDRGVFGWEWITDEFAEREDLDPKLFTISAHDGARMTYYARRIEHLPIPGRDLSTF